ncbi:hypothetical protein OAU36_05290 [Gammaproteobacteria bacterium]|nr:hypothetical protein [Gammaproteobacteria bacterium]MBT6481151.1 hypothetical protein [Gammaproteobacteria bacterium]MBT7225062.1 hypothetical protein [Gammaproteobacteria bacterium]MDC3197122.1 hypothetical protein [Gammaproteobacteria bacterium]HAS48641.1 hypothetical protein [Gammaproteobacteria bacterium]
MTRILTLLSMSLFLFGCQSSAPPEFGMVDWYISNGTSNRMSLDLYDKVCQKSHYRLRIDASTETPISTCANRDGQAEVRFRRTGGISVSQNPLRNEVVNANEYLFVQ